MRSRRLLYIGLMAMAATMYTMRGMTQAREESDSILYTIETLDGNVYQGYIVERQIEYLVFQTVNIGQITIQFNDIQRIVRGNETARPVNHASGRRPEKDFIYTGKYLLTTTGPGLRKKEAYYQNLWLFMNQFNFGLSDYFSFGIGAVPFLGLDEVPVWITPKLTIPIAKDKVYTGIAAINGLVIGDSEAFGIVYGFLTIGNRQNHLSAGLGRAYDSFSDFAGTTFNFSASLKIGKKASLVTENYFLREDGLYTLGIFQPVWDIAIDYGFIIFYEEGEAYGAPTLGITVPLNLSSK